MHSAVISPPSLPLPRTQFTADIREIEVCDVAKVMPCYTNRQARNPTSYAMNPDPRPTPALTGRVECSIRLALRLMPARLDCSLRCLFRLVTSTDRFS